MQKKRSNMVFGIIAAALAAIAVAVVAGILLRYTNGGTENIKTFYLTLNGEKIYSATARCELRPGQNTFEIRYTFGDTVTNKTYTVALLPDPDADFEYTVDGETYAWKDIEDLTAAAEIVCGDSAFTVTPVGYGDLQTVLEAIYPGQAVSVAEGQTPYPFLLVVSNGADEYRLRVGVRVPAAGIEVRPPAIVF